MEMKPENRYQNIQEFLDDLYGTTPPEPVKEVVSRPKSRVWLLPAILAIVAIVVIGFVVYNNVEKNNEIAIQKEIQRQSNIVRDSVGYATIYFDNSSNAAYHLFANCTELSGKSYYGTVEQAFAAGKTTLCPLCLKKVKDFKQLRQNIRDYRETGESLNDRMYLEKALAFCREALTMCPNDERLLKTEKDIQRLMNQIR
jgi:hypothetical protein